MNRGEKSRQYVKWFKAEQMRSMLLAAVGFNFSTHYGKVKEKMHFFMF